MAVNDVYSASAIDVADAGEFLIEGSGSGTGAAEVFELGGTGASTVYKEVDPDGDGTWEVSVQVDTFSTGFHSQDNELVVSDSKNQRLRIVNESGGTADFYAAGMEVND